MNLFRLAPLLDRLAGPVEPPTPGVAAERCVHHWDRASGCRICVDACPTGALVVEEAGVALNPAACAGCGWCLHACPTGALTGSAATDPGAAGIGETGKVWQAAEPMLPVPGVRRTLELTCAVLSTPHVAAEEAVVLQVSGCLAALDAAAYVGLAALGVRRVNVHLEGCAGCPLGALHTRIAETAQRGAALAALVVTALESPPDGAPRKTDCSTRARPVSRRSLLRRLGGARPDTPAAPAALPPLAAPPESSKHPPHSRRALLHALAHLPDDQRAETPFFPLYAAAATCTGCGVCARVCPTGAISITADDGVFALQFAPLACTECGLCAHLCTVGALCFARRVAYADAAPIVLLAGRQSECTRCHATFVGLGSLCPACDFRRRHPAGSLPRPPVVC